MNSPKKLNKTIRMYVDHNWMVVEVAHERSRRLQEEVNESDIIAEALDLYFRTHGVKYPRPTQ